MDAPLPRTDVGLNLAFDYSRFGIEDDDQSTRNLRVEPAFKPCLGARDGFAPYAFGSFFASTGRQTQDGEGGATISVDERVAGAAAGIDGFPARRMSIGGHVGLAAGNGSSRASIQHRTGRYSPSPGASSTVTEPIRAPGSRV